MSNGRGPRRKRRLLDFGIAAFLLLGILPVNAIPVAQVDTAQVATTTTPSTSISTTITPSATPSPTAVTVTSTHTSSSSSSSSSKSSTKAAVGTVVTDSPLVNTDLLSSSSASAASASSLASLASVASLNHSLSASSSINSLFSTSLSATSTSSRPTPYQSPTTDGDGSTTSQESTYNGLVNFYFLILGAAIALAVLGWWIWRRRRKGKTTRDQRRGLEALRRDLELGRLRRGFLGVVRGGNTPNPNMANGTPGTPVEELPAYNPLRSPPTAVTRLPGYEEAVNTPRSPSTTRQLTTIEEEQSIHSRSQTPDPRPPSSRQDDDTTTFR